MYLILSVLGCSKQEINTESNRSYSQSEENSIKIIDGRVAFSNEDVYDTYFQLDSVDLATIRSNLGNDNFVSLLKAKEAEKEIPDSILELNHRFFNLLNEEGLIQVDKHIFRYSYSDGGVWIISEEDYNKPKKRENFYTGILTKDAVGFIPNEVSAFEAIEMGHISMPPHGTRDYNALIDVDLTIAKAAKARTHHEFFHIFNGNSARMRGKLSYEKFAVYFNFYGNEKYQKKNAVNQWYTVVGGDAEWYVEYSYRCRRKGKSTDYVGSGTLNPPSSGDNKVIKTFYDGSRGLKRTSGAGATWWVYNVKSDMRYIERTGGLPAAMYATEYYSGNGFTRYNNFDYPYSVNGPAVPFGISLE